MHDPSGFTAPPLPSAFPTLTASSSPSRGSTTVGGARNELSLGTFFNPSHSLPRPSPSSSSSRGTTPSLMMIGQKRPGPTVSVAEDVGSVMDLSSNEDGEGEAEEDEEEEEEEFQMEDDDVDSPLSVATTSTTGIQGQAYHHQGISPSTTATSDHKTRSKPAAKAGRSLSSKAKGKGKASSQNNDETNRAAASLLLAAEGVTTTNAMGKKKMGTSRKNGNDKKKKAGRACAPCQKAHLTCDDARPCARCVKKNRASECHDGTRKKAKYLQEVPDELLERKQSNPFFQASESHPGHEPMLSGGEDGTPLSGIAGDSPEMPMREISQAQPDPPQPTLSFDPLPFYDTSAFTNEFGSEAANLEYAILSTMLNGNGFSIDGSNFNPGAAGAGGGGGGGGLQSMRAPDGSVSGAQSILLQSPLDQGVHGGSTNGQASTSTNVGGETPVTSFFGGYRTDTTDGPQHSASPTMNPNVMSPPRLQDTARDLFPSVGAEVERRTSSSNDVNTGGFGGGDLLFASQGVVSEPNTTAAASATTSGVPTASTSAAPADAGGPSARPSVMTLTGEQAYRAVTKPYPYAQSYHYLVKHLKHRFEKNDILRIVRALATFRPSLIALQMPLTEEDETFVERTFQRTLVELNKLISFSGTPTVVWRRTGEICLVGTEFGLLTGWQRNELVGNKFIFELMDPSSVVEYYESFAKHAFESTSSSVEMQCVVLGPKGRPVPCAMCFTIRRSVKEYLICRGQMTYSK
ncbi:BZ3500_MvSof-1268-A1-R1_Chr9g10837 [Microbotryum saponariae]|uniref:BZ3500_MvSof-1268-A1-R1_Chr9g10837 protein n=1 Tax=Microbotryum saponariae TaxID=289078 RepID=A0A2X0L2J2_9BASI|nr:BZ3501_MvSof-1269-A2-R1_Chr9g10585 [Microbotryum saponariae]SDA00781.1 BZ3500_MvSof-1268-A1-R1_Chr9g10837 [Microbotryum saponariae]